MNTKVYFGHNDIRFLYYRFKDSQYYSISVILLTILISIVLLVYVIIPQVTNYFSVRSEVLDLRYKIQTINDNINFVNNLDKAELESQLVTTTKSLPSEKDFAVVLNTLNQSALSSGVTLGDYKFSVGNIDSGTKIKGIPAQVSSSIDMNIVVLGDIDKVRKFLKSTYEKYPISEISSINYSNGLATIELQFYYKSYQNIVFKEDEPIARLTSEERALIAKLSTWKTAEALPDLSEPVVGSSSAVPLFE